MDEITESRSSDSKSEKYEEDATPATIESFDNSVQNPTDKRLDRVELSDQ